MALLSELLTPKRIASEARRDPGLTGTVSVVTGPHREGELLRRMNGPEKSNSAIVATRGLLKRLHLIVSTRLTCITHPISACVIGSSAPGSGRLRVAARRRQRHPDDRVLEAAAWDRWTRELRLPAWIDWRAVAYLPGVGPTGFWSFDRADEPRCGRDLGGPQSIGVDRVNPFASIPRAGTAPLRHGPSKTSSIAGRRELGPFCLKTAPRPASFPIRTEG